MPRRRVKRNENNRIKDSAMLPGPVRIFIAVMVNHLNDYEIGKTDSTILMFRILSSYTILDIRERELVIGYLRASMIQTAISDDKD